MILGQLASADCTIRVDLCKPLGITKRTVFADGEALANINPARCLERAREYRAWCNSVNEYVGAIFSLNGQVILANYVHSSGKSLLYTVNKFGASIPLDKLDSQY
jgi:hypothetical protein